MPRNCIVLASVLAMSAAACGTPKCPAGSVRYGSKCRELPGDGGARSEDGGHVTDEDSGRDADASPGEDALDASMPGEKPKNENAALASLSCSPGVLSPAFSPSQTEYVVDVGFGAITAQITAVAAVPDGTTLAIDDAPLVSGLASTPLTLPFGTRKLRITSTADGGAVREYEVSIRRSLVQQAYIKPDKSTANAEFGKGLSEAGLPGQAGAAIVLRGDTLLVGVRGDDGDQGNASNTGIVYQYQRAGGAWAFVRGFRSPTPAAGEQFGVALAVDGDVLAVGAQSSRVGAIDRAGAVYIYKREPSGVYTYLTRLVAPNAGEDDGFGVALALEGDTLAVGAPFEDNSTGALTTDNDDANARGAVYVFERSAGTWGFKQYLKPLGGNVFGLSLALEGATLVVGSGQNAFAYRREQSGFASAVTLAPDPSDMTGFFGTAVALQGRHIAVGAYGSVTLFEANGSGWDRQEFVARSGTGFGWALALTSTRLFVGAPGESSPGRGVSTTIPSGGDGANAGAVFVYDLALRRELFVKASNADANDAFGTTVVVDGDSLAVGAPGEDSGAMDVNGDQGRNDVSSAGAVYVFHPDCGALDLGVSLPGC